MVPQSSESIFWWLNVFAGKWAFLFKVIWAEFVKNQQTLQGSMYLLHCNSMQCWIQDCNGAICAHGCDLLYSRLFEHVCEKKVRKIYVDPCHGFMLVCHYNATKHGSGVSMVQPVHMNVSTWFKQRLWEKKRGIHAMDLNLSSLQCQEAVDLVFCVA